MAELTTDAQALSEAATSFDRISLDLKSAIGQVDSTAGDLASALHGPAGAECVDVFDFKATEAGEERSGMQDTEKHVSGMFNAPEPEAGEVDTDLSLSAVDVLGIPATLDECGFLLG
jgi:hypothetical protein